MLLYGSLSDPVALADGSVQVTASVAPGPSDHRAALDPAILRAAVAEFITSAPALLEQFTPGATAAAWSMTSPSTHRALSMSPSR